MVKFGVRVRLPAVSRPKRSRSQCISCCRHAHKQDPCPAHLFTYRDPNIFSAWTTSRSHSGIFRVLSEVATRMANLVVTVLSAAVIGVLTYSAYTAFVNLYLHSLSKFPGPRLAAATSLWRVWHPSRPNTQCRHSPRSDSVVDRLMWKWYKLGRFVMSLRNCIKFTVSI